MFTGSSEDAIGAPARTGETAVAAVQAVTVVVAVSGGRRPWRARPKPCSCTGAAVGAAGAVVGAGKPAAVVTVPKAKPGVVHAF